MAVAGFIATPPGKPERSAALFSVQPARAASPTNPAAAHASPVSHPAQEGLEVAPFLPAGFTRVCIEARRDHGALSNGTFAGECGGPPARKN